MNKFSPLNTPTPSHLPHPTTPTYRTTLPNFSSIEVVPTSVDSSYHFDGNACPHRLSIPPPPLPLSPPHSCCPKHISNPLPPVSLFFGHSTLRMAPCQRIPANTQQLNTLHYDMNCHFMIFVIRASKKINFDIEFELSLSLSYVA